LTEKRLHLTLLQKALLYVAVPLLCELCLLTAVTWFLYMSEQEATEAEHAKVIIAKTEDVIQKFFDVGFAYVAYDVKTNDLFGTRLNDVMSELPQGLQELQDLVSNDPGQSSIVKQVRAKTATALNILETRKASIERGGHLDISEALGLRAQLDAIVHELDGIVEESRIAQKRDPQAAERLKAIAKVLLLLGAIIGLIALLLVARFNAGTTKRLSILMHNSVQLGAGTSLAPLLSGDDEIARIDRVFHHAVDALTEAARKERAMIDNAADVICSIGESGTFTSVSPAAIKLWGYDPTELVGKDWRMVITADHAVQFDRFIKNIRTTGSDDVLEIKLLRKDGALADMRWSAHWSASDHSLFCVVYDVTERLEAERFKQQFSNMISHDLRTPLTAVQSTLELLAANVYGPLSEKAVSKVSRAKGNLDHTIKLINNLLDLEKMNTSTMQMQIRKTALKPMLDRCAAAVSPIAESRDVTIDLPDTEIALDLDEQRISQVVINLLGNALKFSPKSSIIKVDIEIDASQMKLTVSDQGPGIAVDKRAQIFERFLQLPSTRKSVEIFVGAKIEGTGLGLAICKAIVEAHGGEIGVDGAAGGGSAFWFWIPITGKTLAS